MSDYAGQRTKIILKCKMSFQNILHNPAAEDLAQPGGGTPRTTGELDV